MLLSAMSRSTRPLIGASMPRVSFDQRESELGDQGEPHAEQRRHQGAVDLEPFAEEAGDVSDPEQDERGDPERSGDQAIDEEADREAGHGTRHAAAEQAEDDDERGKDVGAGIEECHAGEEGELEQHDQNRDQDEAGKDLRRDDHLRGPPVSICTRSRFARSANGRR